MIYKILSTAFWFIRQFCMSNPFEVLGDGIIATIGGSEILLTPDLLNWIAGAILPAFTFLIVGMYYISGSCPAAGSILYMVFFCIHTFILYLMSWAYPSIFLIVLILIAYIALHVAINVISNKLRSF